MNLLVLVGLAVSWLEASSHPCGGGGQRHGSDRMTIVVVQPGTQQPVTQQTPMSITVAGRKRRDVQTPPGKQTHAALQISSSKETNGLGSFQGGLPHHLGSRGLPLTAGASGIKLDAEFNKEKYTGNRIIFNKKTDGSSSGSLKSKSEVKSKAFHIGSGLTLKPNQGELALPHKLVYSSDKKSSEGEISHKQHNHEHVSGETKSFSESRSSKKNQASLFDLKGGHARGTGADAKSSGERRSGGQSGSYHVEAGAKGASGSSSSVGQGHDHLGGHLEHMNNVASSVRKTVHDKAETAHAVGGGLLHMAGGKAADVGSKVQHIQHHFASEHVGAGIANHGGSAGIHLNQEENSGKGAKHDGSSKLSGKSADNSISHSKATSKAIGVSVGIKTNAGKGQGMQKQLKNVANSAKETVHGTAITAQKGGEGLLHIAGGKVKDIGHIASKHAGEAGFAQHGESFGIHSNKEDNSGAKHDATAKLGASKSTGVALAAGKLAEHSFSQSIGASKAMGASGGISTNAGRGQEHLEQLKHFAISAKDKGDTGHQAFHTLTNTPHLGVKPAHLGGSAESSALHSGTSATGTKGSVKDLISLPQLHGTTAGRAIRVGYASH